MINIYSLEKEGIPFYIGKTNNPHRRLIQHKRIYGKINMIILDKINNDENKFWEKFYISLYKSWGFTLTNKNNGGGGLLYHSQESKDKIAKANKGRKFKWKDPNKTKERRINYFKNRINNWGDKISKTKQGKSIPSTFKKVNQYTLEGIFIKEYPSVTIAAHELKILRGNIASCCRGKLKTAYKFKWEFTK